MTGRNFAIVTGASEGIGKAIALSLLQHGYRVALVSRSQEKLDQFLAQAGDNAQHAWAYPADLTDPLEVGQLIAEVIQREGKIDVLVNNLGRGIRRELVDTTDAEWDFLAKVNLSSAFYVCRAVLPYMRKQKAGRIVNIASRAGRCGEGDFAAYSVMKHGLVGLTRALADSEAGYGIFVNAVCPGAVATERMLSSHPDGEDAQWSKPDDVAQTVLFLLSPAARMMNGQVIDLFKK